MSDNFSDVIVIIAWVVTTGIPTVVAIIKHLREKAYKDAAKDLMDAIEKYDNGDVKEAVSKVMSAKLHKQVVAPYLKEAGYDQENTSSATDRSNDLAD
jgi:predicted solute-binding protein